jgi:hypothetical protein
MAATRGLLVPGKSGGSLYQYAMHIETMETHALGILWGDGLMLSPGLPVRYGSNARKPPVTNIGL